MEFESFLSETATAATASEYLVNTVWTTEGKKYFAAFKVWSEGGGSDEKEFSYYCSKKCGFL